MSSKLSAGEAVPLARGTRYAGEGPAHISFRGPEASRFAALVAGGADDPVQGWARYDDPFLRRFFAPDHLMHWEAGEQDCSCWTWQAAVVSQPWPPDRIGYGELLVTAQFPPEDIPLLTARLSAPAE